MPASRNPRSGAPPSELGVRGVPPYAVPEGVDGDKVPAALMSGALAPLPLTSLKQRPRGGPKLPRRKLW
eukprot:1464501-Alexandrium_andersonii.AAC.1